MRAGGTILGIACFSWVSNAVAHDQWLVPEPSASNVALRLVVGEAPTFEEEKPFERSKVTSFALRSNVGPIDLLGAGREGEKPFARVDALGDGAFLASVERAPVLITLSAPKFDAYLSEEHLDAVKKERARLSETASVGRERYTRHMKSLFWMGAPRADAVAKATLGHRLEIVLDTDPATTRELAFHVVFEGKPLVGATVEASSTKRTISATTCADGKSTWKLDAGAWVLHLVHMRRCANCKDADWESAWASYALSVP